MWEYSYNDYENSATTDAGHVAKALAGKARSRLIRYASMAYGYQDDSFDVDEVRGQRLAGLLLFMDDESPQKLVGVLENGQRFHFYLSAFIGFWSELDEEGYEDVLSDYEDCVALDYAAKHHLSGLEIIEATCHKALKGTCISIRFESGVLKLTEVDPTDPHSDSAIEFVQKAV